MEVNEALKTESKFNQKLLDDIKEIRKYISRDKDDRNRWEDKLVIATNQRLGVNRQAKLPYPGAPNIPLPESDKQIKNKTPGYVLSVMAQDKPVSISFGASMPYATQEMIEMKKRAELGFNYAIKHKMNFLDELTVAADQFQEKGHCIFKIVEKFSKVSIRRIIDTQDFDEVILEDIKSLDVTDRRTVIADHVGLDLEADIDTIVDIDEKLLAGDRFIKYDVDVIESFPTVICVDSENIVVPPNTNEINTAERVRHRFYLSYRELYERGLDETYDIKKIKKLKEGKENSDTERGSGSGIIFDDPVKDEKEYNEGIDTDDVDTYQVSEVYFWRQTGEDGRFERWVATILDDVADDNDATIQVIRFPYDFDEWNFEKHDNEKRDHRYFSSRGIPEQIRAMQDFMERSMNSMIIRDEINNNPMFTIRRTADFNPALMRFTPGQGLLVDDHDDIREFGGLKGSRVEMSAQTIMQVLKGFIEEYLGSTDQLFRNATNRGGGKTLGEIQIGMQKAAAQQSLDLLRWNETLKRVYQKLWALFKTRLGEPLVINGVIVSKSDFNFDAEILPTGTIEATNTLEKVQRASTILQLVMQQIQMGLVCNAEDLYNALFDMLEKMGEHNPERYITRPEVIQQAKMEAMQAQDRVLAQAEQQLGAEAQQEGEMDGGLQ